MRYRTACASDLLVIGNYIARRLVVNYEREVWFVIAHAQSTGCDKAFERIGRQGIFQALSLLGVDV